MWSAVVPTADIAQAPWPSHPSSALPDIGTGKQTLRQPQTLHQALETVGIEMGRTAGDHEAVEIMLHSSALDGPQTRWVARPPYPVHIAHVTQLLGSGRQCGEVELLIQITVTAAQKEADAGWLMAH